MLEAIFGILQAEVDCMEQQQHGGASSWHCPFLRQLSRQQKKVTDVFPCVPLLNVSTARQVNPDKLQLHARCLRVQLLHLAVSLEATVTVRMPLSAAVVVSMYML